MEWLALKLVPGSKAVFTSADQPGLIYDVLAVSPESLSQRRDDWLKVLKVWYRIVDYIGSPETHADAVKIMSSRVGISPDEYSTIMKGTHIMTLEEAKKAFAKGDGYTSIYGSSKISDDFNVANKVYDDPQDVDSYVDPSLTNGL